jgi:unsaturated rhamnogalacturonyl hydrolase
LPRRSSGGYSVATAEPDENDLKDLIDAVVRRTMKVDFGWDWPAGVAFYGICRAWEATGRREYIDAVQAWVDEYLEIGLPPFTVNRVSMGHALISLHEATGERKYLDVAVRKAEYLSREARRFGEGVMQHTVSVKNDFPEQAWSDTLFMAAYFLLRLGLKTGNEAWIEDSLNQWYWHEELLQDAQTDLFYHGWDNVSQNHLSEIFWARGNAWAAYTMARALRLIDYLYPMYMRIDGSLRDQLAALVRLQGPDGLWHTVLDDEESYGETSASAGIAAALATNALPLHRKCVARAYEGIRANIGSDGAVTNVSGGTAVMPDVAAYRSIPRKRVQGWGQGLVLAFLAALAESNAGEPENG